MTTRTWVGPVVVSGAVDLSSEDDPCAWTGPAADLSSATVITLHLLDRKMCLIDTNKPRAHARVQVLNGCFFSRPCSARWP